MNLAYNLSEKLKSYLASIDRLRGEILLSPLSPKNELRLKWDFTLERVLWSLSLLDNPLSKPDAVRLLSGTSAPTKKRLVSAEKDVVNQKKTFDYIKEAWSVNPSPVSMTTVKKLYEFSSRETAGKMSGLTEYSEKKMDSFLNYLQRGQDHPVIQAGIAQVETINITPFDAANGRIARLLSYLFLYKTGYDIRDMFILEEFYKRDLVTYKRMLEISKSQGNLTLWLEYFAFGMGTALAKSLDIIKNLKFQEDLPASYWKLNNRQRQILTYLEQPGLKITNKEVQKTHGISQITASRDLSKLASLGLLLAHGKGRSVFYTRV